jgi:uncharacterized membrane protein YhaH (DUF805 family)
MSFVGAIQSGFRNYVNFRGKASRSEFWYWVLFVVLIGLVVSTIESVIWPADELQGDWMQDLSNISAQPTPLSNILSIALFLPNLAVTARRFHDAGFSGKWLLLQLVPLGYGIFAGAGAVVVLNSAAPGMLTRDELLSLIFLVLPIFALLLAVMVIFLVMALRPSRSFYDGNRYVEPEPISGMDEGTTA